MKKQLFTSDSMYMIVIGLKTQTRRIGSLSRFRTFAGRWQREGDMMVFDGGIERVPMPKPAHKVGDVVAAVSTWAVEPKYDDLKPSEINLGKWDVFWHDGALNENGRIDKPAWMGKSRPGRFLPKSLYHLFPKIRITAVRAERLQEITLADAIMEGCPLDRLEGLAPLDWFEEQWNSVNGKRGCSYNCNPHVWVYEFEKEPASGN